MYAGVLSMLSDKTKHSRMLHGLKTEMVVRGGEPEGLKSSPFTEFAEALFLERVRLFHRLATAFTRLKTTWNA
jgi:hypothetical protein